jgi:hypothetical protein
MQEHILNPLSMRLLEGDLSGLGFEPFGKWRKGFVPRCGTKAARPTELARRSPLAKGLRVAKQQSFTWATIGKSGSSICSALRDEGR